MKYPDKTKRRIYGVPGTPGDYQEFAATKVGAIAAEQRAKELAGKPRAVPEPIKEVTKTIREHAETFVETYKPGSKPSTRRAKTYILNGYLLPYFGDLRIEDLKQTELDTFARVELKRGMAIKTVNERLTVLSSLIKYVTGEKSRLRFKLAGMTGEMTAVAMEDVEKLIKAATDERYRVAILLAAEAGLRAGEIRGLQWTDVKDGQITIRRGLDNATNEMIAPKNNLPRLVPLSPRILAALATLPKLGIWVVSRLDGGALGYYGMIEAFGAIYDRAKVARPPKPIHCLRHTFGTVMARKVPLGVLQELMGHAEVTTTMRYVHVSEGDKREAIETVFGVAATRQRESKK